MTLSRFPNLQSLLTGLGLSPSIDPLQALGAPPSLSSPLFGPPPRFPGLMETLANPALLQRPPLPPANPFQPPFGGPCLSASPFAAPPSAPGFGAPLAPHRGLQAVGPGFPAPAFPPTSLLPEGFPGGDLGSIASRTVSQLPTPAVPDPAPPRRPRSPSSRPTESKPVPPGA